MAHGCHTLLTLFLIFSNLQFAFWLFSFFFISLLLSFFLAFVLFLLILWIILIVVFLYLHTLQQFKLSQNFASSPLQTYILFFPQISLLHVKSIYSFLTYFFGRSESFAFVTPRIHLVSFLQTLRFCLTRFISLILLALPGSLSY